MRNLVRCAFVGAIALMLGSPTQAQFASGLSGRWVGKLGHARGGSYEIEVVRNAQGQWTVTYGLPPYACSSNLILIEDSSRRARFEVKAVGGCIPGVLTLARESPTRLVGFWHEQDGTSLVATGELLLTPASIRVVLDGDFGDWGAVPIAYRAPAGPVPAHFRAVRLAADEHFVSLQLDFDREVNVTALGGALSVLIDGDGDPKTGRMIYGRPGTDLAIEMSPAPAVGSGILVHWIPSTGGEIAADGPGAIGLVRAPSYAARRVEVQINRNLTRPGTTSRPLLSTRRATLQLVFSQDPVARLEYGTSRNPKILTPPLALALPPTVPQTTLGPDERVPAIDPLARPANTDLRVLVWNVSGLPQSRRDAFARILAAIDADLLMLDESAALLAASDMEQWLSTTLGSRGERWRVLVGQSGERSLVAARSEVSEAFGKLSYPADEVNRVLLPLVQADERDRFRDARAAGGIGATGALVTVATRRLLVVPLDLTCCGNSSTSLQTAQRVIEATTVQAAIARTRDAVRPDAVLVGGDLNLISTRAPLDILRRGLDRDQRPLAIVRAVQLSGRSLDTYRGWRGDSGFFPPAQLDWLLFTSSSLEQVGAFVFASNDLSPYWLKHHKLSVDDSWVSDHQPIVADFRWKR